ncbi:MAG: response regulator [Firmicutes bacterium]|nr:response regulator [Bacillota bacterium]
MDSQLRILMVEDVPEDAELIERELRSGGLDFITICVDVKEAFLTALEEFKPDLVIADYAMPSFNGMEALQLALEHDDTLPVVIVTGSMYEDIAVECMKLDAADYVIKEHLTRLPFAIRRALDRRKAQQTQKKATEALQAAEERFSTIYKVNPMAMSLISLSENRFVDVNDRWQDLFGYSLVDVIGNKVNEIPIYMHAHSEDAFCEHLCGSKMLDREFEFKTKSGEEITVLSSVKLLELRGEKYCLNVMDDITQQRRLQKELMRLERLESVGLLAGGIAHDFNNILTVILGYISLARNCSDDKDVIANSMREVEIATRQAVALTHQLLTFAKGGTPIKKTLSIIELIKESAKFTLHGSNIGCNFSIADDLMAVDVDYDQISQVLNNLVINALQAMPLGGTLKIMAENYCINEASALPLIEGDYIRVTVQDTGEGIPPEVCKNIFDPYFTTKSTGSGLGLTTSHSIINQHNGYIEVESQVGQGTTFTIYLPASKLAVENTVCSNQNVITGSGKVLVMDDEESVRRVVVEMLSFLGYDFELACNGVEAISLYSQAVASGKTYDAVILDLTVRGSMGGKETIKELMSINPQVRAIVSSGYSEDAVLSDFQSYGFKGLVAKPYRLEELAKVLHRVIFEESA